MKRNNKRKKQEIFLVLVNTNWRFCAQCQRVKNEAERLCCFDTNEVPDDYFDIQ